MIERAAARIGCTESQAWTLLVGFVLATLMAVLGIPPTLQERVATALPPQAVAPEQPGVPVTVPPADAPPPPADVPFAPSAAVPVVPPALASDPLLDLQPAPADPALPPAPPPVDPPPVEAPPPAPAAGPATVVAAGYSAPVGGTPLAGAVVAEGTLPVGRQPGAGDTRSYLLLGSDGSQLQLRLRSATPSADVVLCPLAADGYQPVRGQNASEAPELDCASAVAPTVVGDMFSFDLSTLSAQARGRGVAVVPAEGAVAFSAAFDDPTATPDPAAAAAAGVRLPSGPVEAWLTDLFPWLVGG